MTSPGGKAQKLGGDLASQVHLSWVLPAAPRRGQVMGGIAQGKTLTPLKFQSLGDGNMGKLFCRCRLGLEEDKKGDALIIQRKSPVSDGVSSEGEMLAEMVQAGWSGWSSLQLSNLEQPNTL